MIRLRDARPDDLPALVELARAAGVGLTTFPADADRLARRLADAANGSAPLFVLEDRAARRLLGVSGLVRGTPASGRGPGDADATPSSENPSAPRGVTAPEPFYAFRLERSVHRSDTLGVHHEVQTLHLVADRDAPTEIGTLFLHPDARGRGHGRLLSLGRFLYLANTPQRFRPGVIAELRGVIDDQGRSPFWEGVGRHFFQVDYAVADAMSARDKRFIAELMPTHPIYVPLLPEAARAVIGQVHPHTAPAKKLLENEGFHATPLVDLFDAGPALRCDLQAIRTARTSCVRPVIGATAKMNNVPADCLVGTVTPPFVAVACAAEVTANHVTLPPGALEALEIVPGAAVRVAPLRGSGNAEALAR